MRYFQGKHRNIGLILVFSCLAACSPDNSSHMLFEHPAYHFPYQINDPDRSWKLPQSLVEISGLGYVDAERLACVQDEKGIIFLFNLEIGKIEREIKFGDDGDYEGIEIIGRDAWVLKSNGKSYEVKDFLNVKPPVVNEYKSDLSGRNDAEGLAYDPVTNGLFIALKGHPFTDGRDGGGKKAIYRFDLETYKLDPEPFLLIHLDTVSRYRDYGGMSRLGNRIMSNLDPSEGDKTFQPSGIAVHPVTGHIFVLGSVGRLLLVFTREGEMLAMAGLSRALFFQPEGICFDPQGNLYIASEGGSGYATVLRFER